MTIWHFPMYRALLWWRQGAKSTCLAFQPLLLTLGILHTLPNSASKTLSVSLWASHKHPSPLFFSLPVTILTSSCTLPPMYYFNWWCISPVFALCLLLVHGKMCPGQGEVGYRKIKSGKRENIQMDLSLGFREGFFKLPTELATSCNVTLHSQLLKNSQHHYCYITGQSINASFELKNGWSSGSRIFEIYREALHAMEVFITSSLDRSKQPQQCVIRTWETNHLPSFLSQIHTDRVSSHESHTPVPTLSYTSTGEGKKKEEESNRHR